MARHLGRLGVCDRRGRAHPLFDVTVREIDRLQTHLDVSDTAGGTIRAATECLLLALHHDLLLAHARMA